MTDEIPGRQAAEEKFKLADELCRWHKLKGG
jgi:hypothetical protein